MGIGFRTPERRVSGTEPKCKTVNTVEFIRRRSLALFLLDLRKANAAKFLVDNLDTEPNKYNKYDLLVISVETIVTLVLEH